MFQIVIGTDAIGEMLLRVGTILSGNPNYLTSQKYRYKTEGSFEGVHMFNAIPAPYPCLHSVGGIL